MVHGRLDPVIVLIGFMGSGKTTIGKKVARRLGVPFIDSDLALETRTGRTCADIITTDGEEAFRVLEKEIIHDLLRSSDGVLSLGGGAITTEQVRRELIDHCVIYLQLSIKDALRRVGNDPSRPLAQGDVCGRFIERQPLYESVATSTVEATGTPAQVASKVQIALGLEPDSPLPAHMSGK